MFIDDGGGNGRQAKVSRNNQVLVLSTITSFSAWTSKEYGQDFGWVSSYAATAADYVVYIMNLDTTNYLRVNRLIFSSTVATLWTLIKVTGGTPAGTTITGTNTNFSSGKTALVTALGNAAVTGSPTGTVINKIHTAISTPFEYRVEGSIILPVNTAIAVQASATGTIAVFISGWFEDITGV